MLILVHKGPSIKDVRSKGGVCEPMWTIAYGRGADKLVGHQADVHKRFISGISESVSESDTPLPHVHGRPDCNICEFRTFYARYGPDVFEREGGVSTKSVFARTSLMDDPLLLYYKKTYIVYTIYW